MKVVAIFFKGVVIAQNAKEGAIGRNLFIVHLLWTIEPFLRKETLCLIGLASFEERLKADATIEEFHKVK